MRDSSGFNLGAKGNIIVRGSGNKQGSQPDKP